MTHTETFDLKADARTIEWEEPNDQPTDLQVTQPEWEAYQKAGVSSAETGLAAPEWDRFGTLEPVGKLQNTGAEIDVAGLASKMEMRATVDWDLRLRLVGASGADSLIAHLRDTVKTAEQNSPVYLRLDSVRLGALVADQLCQQLFSRDRPEGRVVVGKPVVFVNPAPEDTLSLHRVLQVKNESTMVYFTENRELIYVGNLQKYLRDVLDLMVQRAENLSEATSTSDVLRSDITSSTGDASNRLIKLFEDGFIHRVGVVSTGTGGRPKTLYKLFHPEGGQTYGLYQPPGESPPERDPLVRRGRKKVTSSS